MGDEQQTGGQQGNHHDLGRADPIGQCAQTGRRDHTGKPRRGEHHAGKQGDIGGIAGQFGDVNGQDRLNRHQGQLQHERRGEHRHRHFRIRHHLTNFPESRRRFYRRREFFRDKQQRRQKGNEQQAADYEKDAAEPEQIGDRPAEQRSQQHAGDRAGGQGAQGPAGSLFRGLGGDQSNGGRIIAGDRALQQAEADQLIDILYKAHAGQDNGHAHTGAQQHWLAAVAVGGFAPDRGKYGHQDERDSVGEAGPFFNFRYIFDTQLLDK